MTASRCRIRSAVVRRRNGPGRRRTWPAGEDQRPGPGPGLLPPRGHGGRCRGRCPAALSRPGCGRSSRLGRRARPMYSRRRRRSSSVVGPVGRARDSTRARSTSRGRSAMLTRAAFTTAPSSVGVQPPAGRRTINPGGTAACAHTAQGVGGGRADPHGPGRTVAVWTSVNCRVQQRNRTQDVTPRSPL